jgi:deoxyribonuclease-4
MAKNSSKGLLIGAHTSAAGGVHNALLQGREIGATTIQLFTSNQKRWDSKPIDPEEIERWFDALKETNLTQIMSHDSYLINLGAPDEGVLQKSRQAFAEEIKRCVSLDISYLNFHPGASLKEDREKCMDKIAASLSEVAHLLEGSTTRLLLETTAGQGSALGYRFEELAYILDKVEKKVPVGVCIDTCHIFAAGYDIRTSLAWDTTLQEFEKIVGLKHLYAFHLNDSVKELGSRVDRHAHLGEGKIGLDCFKFLMSDPRTQELPKFLETPEGPSRWKQEIQMLREYAHKN